MKYLCYIGFFCLMPLLGIGQYERPIKHWGFDETSRNKDHFNLFGSTSSQIVFAEGVKGQSVVLYQKKYGLDLTQYLEIDDDFSLVFWMRPYELKEGQTLIYQVKENRNGVIDRFIHFGVQNKKLYLKTDKGIQGLFYTPPLEAQKWYQIAYTYDGFEVAIFLNKQLVYKTKETSIYNKSPYKIDRVFIGKNSHIAKNFQGALDEIMIFDEGVSKANISLIFENYRPKKAATEPPNPKPDTMPKKVIAQPSKKDKHFAKKYKNRDNQIQDSIKINTTNIAFEIWDYDEFDNDRLRLILNQDKVIQTDIPLKRKRKKRKYEIKQHLLTPNANNYITFYAEDMGKYSSQNTAAVRLWIDGKKRDKIYKLVLTEEVNAVLKIIHTDKPQKNEALKTTTKPQYRVVQKIKTVDEITATDTKLLLQLRDLNDKSHKVHIRLNNDTVAAAFPLNYRNKKLDLNIQTHQLNHLLINGYQLPQKQKSRLECTIFEGDKLLGKYKIRLDRTHLKIPIRYQQTAVKTRSPRHKHELTVQDTVITISVMDNSIVDGDIISIQQEDTLILKNYTLTENLKTMTVQLKKNATNKFLFIPMSMGSKNTENTALVIIEADGRVVDKFRLSSKTKDNPAVLTIVHKKE